MNTSHKKLLVLKFSIVMLRLSLSLKDDTKIKLELLQKSQSIAFYKSFFKMDFYSHQAQSYRNIYPRHSILLLSIIWYQQALYNNLLLVEMKRCYYEVLQVDKKATPAEIKTSYRKLAMKHHPDKNSEEGSKERFVQINEAYNVLSDPNERTWYDNNREKLLYNKDEMSKEDIEQYSFGFNIWTYFTTGCFKGYEDGEGGFYAVYRDVFEKIKSEEAKAFNMREDLQQQLKKYQGFGDSNTSQDRVLKFYEDWENFSTYKTFVWSEQWDTRDANSRWVRRQMQKENKKQRQGEKKTYIKTIKDLLSYVKKRDPRFMEYLRQLKEEEEKKELERLERQKEKKKEKEEMKVIKQKLEEERFREIEQYYKRQNESTNTATTSAPNKQTQAKAKHYEEDEVQLSEFYCQICEKQFKSQNQLRNHEKSKQHKQMIKDIEREVLLKEQILQKAQEQEMEEFKKAVKQQQTQQQQQTKEEDISPSKKKKNKKKKNQQQKKEEQSEQEKVEPPKQQVKEEVKKVEPPKKSAKKEEEAKSAKDSSSDDEDHFMNTLLNNRVKKTDVKKVPVEVEPPKIAKNDKKKKQAKAVEQESEDEEQNEKEEQRLGKAKLKKQKKAAGQQKADKANELKCKGCSESFPSKTKLFEHINKTGHASAK